MLFKDGAAVGVGAGQMSRVEAVQIAVQRAGERARGSVMASDAFFPFPDGLEEGIRAGVTAVIQPGGSLKDADVVAAADAAGHRDGHDRPPPLQALVDRPKLDS